MGDSQTIINYQHGNVKVTDEKSSMVLVYRVVTECCWYSLINNYMINSNLKYEKITISMLWQEHYCILISITPSIINSYWINLKKQWVFNSLITNLL